MTRKYVSPQIEVIKITLSGCLATSGSHEKPKESDNIDPGLSWGKSPHFDSLFDVEM